MSRSGILIVAGSAGVREAFAQRLRAAGWKTVDAAASAASAVEMMRMVNYGCAVVHSEVEDMTGVQAVPVLAAAAPHLKIIFATPTSSVELEARARELGIFYYYICESQGSGELDAAVADAIGPPRHGASRVSKILIVDDDQPFVRAVGYVLKAHGYAVVSAASRDEGLRLARQERPDLVLLDIMLESATDGLLFCHEVRRDPLIKHTPIIAVSAFGGRTGIPFLTRDESDLLPVDGFLEKPVDPKEIIAHIERLVAEDG